MVIVVGNNDSSIHYPSFSSYNAQQNAGLLKVHLRSVRTPLASRPVRWEELLTRTFLQKFPLRNARAARGRWILQLLYLAFCCLIFLRLSESIFVCVCVFLCLFICVSVGFRFSIVSKWKLTQLFFVMVEISNKRISGNLLLSFPVTCFLLAFFFC